MLLGILIILAFLLTALYYQLTSKYDYWIKRGVKCMKPIFPFGNLKEQILLRKSRLQFNEELYYFGAGERYVGFIQTREPVLLIRDPELIRHVLGKDFSYFHDRGLFYDEKDDPLSGHLFNLGGAKWRSLRAKLTPTFTSGKIKNMMPFVQECADEMVNLLDGYAKSEKVVEMRDILSRYTIDIIGSCAFGVQCNSLRNPDSEFRRIGELVVKRDKVRFIKSIIVTLFPKILRYLPLPAAWTKGTNYFLNAIKETVKFRKEKNVQRNDFLDLLIQIKNRGTIVENTEELKNDAFTRKMGDAKIEDFEFTETSMAAQAFIFFLAGFETSAVSLSYTLIEISHNLEIQEKLRQEIDRSFEKNGNKFTYEAVMGLPYLDKVVSESLRRHPPVMNLLRKVTEEYQVPDSDLVLEKGLGVCIPVHAIHNDPDLYPDPEQFDPERFSDEGKRTRHNYAYLPFGEGPRNCIASRFGLLQEKLGLAVLLKNFEFDLAPEMPYPPVFSKEAGMILNNEHGTYLRIKKRS